MQTIGSPVLWTLLSAFVDLDNHPALKWIRSRFRISPDYDGEKFFTRVGGVRMATLLLVVFLLIGIVDIVFAVDSIRPSSRRRSPWP